MIVDNNFLKQVPIAEGGESYIYEYNDKVIKVYKDHIDKQDKFKRISLLMTKNLSSKIIKPLDMVYDRNNRFIGFVMDKVEGNELKQLSSKKFCKTNKITVQQVLKLLVNIKSTLKQLHSQGIYVSDLNEKNILFDDNFNAFFIDIDSWTIDGIKSYICMETFQDPLLISNNFNEKTDQYAFALLIFKTLTRLHPFGGKTDPDMDILERMKKKISVLGNYPITIPKSLVNDWNFMSPELLKSLKEIYEEEKRFLLDKELDTLNENLKFCSKHDDYYYSKFSSCPVCNNTAKIEDTIEPPIRVTGNATIPYLVLLENKNINFIIDRNTYLDNDYFICSKDGQTKVPFDKKYKYYFSERGDILYQVSNRQIFVNHRGKTYSFDKLNGTRIVVRDNKIYYINLNSTLTELTITERGNASKLLTKVSFNSLFEIIDDKTFLVVNIYDNMKVVNINGYNYEWKNEDKIINDGIHYDYNTGHWLVILENSKGKFETKVFSKNKVLFETNKVRFTTNLNYLTFNNNIIYKPDNGKIVAFSFEKNLIKEFPVNIINDSSNLEKQKDKFIVINEDKIYIVG